MADPEIEEDLDGLDKLTVSLYRAGLAVSAVGVALGAVGEVVGWERDVWPVTAAGVALSVLDMHLYDKRIRWIIAAAGVLGLVLLAAEGSVPEAARHVVHTAGLGFLFVSLSGFALKEQFCFKIPFLRAVPLLLAGAVLPLLAGWSWTAAALLVPAAVLIGVLAAAKLRQPLHYDIGDKSSYQI